MARRYGKRTLACMLLLSLLFLSGCSFSFTGINGEVYRFGEREEPLSSEDEAVWAEDVLIRVGETEVTYPEVVFYLLSTKDRYEERFGSRIWKIPYEGKTIGERAKEDALKELIEVKIVSGKAREAGYAIGEDESVELARIAEEQLQNISMTLKSLYLLDEDLLTAVYEDNYLASRFVDTVLAEHPDKEYQELLVLWESETEVEVDEEKIAALTLDNIGY